MKDILTDICVTMLSAKMEPYLSQAEGDVWSQIKGSKGGFFSKFQSF